MRYFIVGTYIYCAAQSAAEQILATGAAVREITEDEFQIHKAAYDEFWKDVREDDYQDDPYYLDYQFESEGLLQPVQAHQNYDIDGVVACWVNDAKHGLMWVVKRKVA